MTKSRRALGPVLRLHRTVALLATALVLLPLFTARPADAGWWDSAAEARESTIAQLRREPEQWRDVPVLLRVSFTATRDRANPYFTQFTPEHWRPISVEPALRPGGPQRGMAAKATTFDTLFVRRGGAADLRLPSLRAGRSLLLRAAVRDVVGGEPWIEVISITVAGDPLTPEERTRVRSADRFLSRANPGAAEKLYRRVMNGRPLADLDRATLLRKLGVCLRDQRRGDDALAAFRAALALDPDHTDTRTRIAVIEERLARTPIAPAAGTAHTDAPGPPNAGRAAPSTPRPDTPLYLPGGRPALAPPGGATDADGGTPREAAPTERNATERRSLRAPTTRKPTLPAPLPRSRVPTPDAPDASKPSRTPEPARRSESDAHDEDEQEPSPPPVPARPGLSGPK